MRKNLIIPAVIIILAAAAFAWWNWHSNPADENRTGYAPAAPATSTPAVPPASSAPVSAAPGNVQTFTVTGQNFSFNPSVIRVKQGTTVKIVFNDADGFHNLVVDGYNAQTETIQSGQTSEVQFVADKTGSFAYYCSVGTHRALGMQGTLIVE